MPFIGDHHWSAEQLLRDFRILGYGTSYVAVVRKTDGTEGTLQFSGTPRTYFDFQPAGCRQ